MRGMPRIASLVCTAYVEDPRLRPVHLDLQGGNERIVGINDRVIGLPFSPTVNRIAPPTVPEVM
jgi:hypothetical protein